MAEPHPPGNNTITTKLPSEILFFQILPRLPVKSLPNAMCVCKKWYLFLKSGAFATTYHHHVLTDDDHQNHHKHFVLFPTDRNMHSIDCEIPQNGLTEGRGIPYFSPYYADLSILTSLHGMLLVGTTEYKHADVYHYLILWNPLTDAYKILSKPKQLGCDHYKECYNISKGIFGLYYISSVDDYRLLRVTHHLNIYIYSLKSNSWRKVESTKDFRQTASNWTSLKSNSQRKVEPQRPSHWTSCGRGSYPELPSHHILLNEKLYFLKQVMNRGGTFVQSYSVVRFDAKTEKFTEIAIPSFGNKMTNCLGFMLLKGCIHFCVAIRIQKENYMANRRRQSYEMIELWRMDGDGDWTKVLSYSLMSFSVWGQSMLHLMKNGNLLIHNRGDIYVLDMKKHTKVKLSTCDRSDYDIPLTGKYIETTVSPNRSNVRKWFLTKNGLEWCILRSWEEYNAFERDMFEKYGEDITQHAGSANELCALIQRGRKDRTFGMGSSNHQFMVTGASPYGAAISSIEYVQSQMQVRELQIQLEMERKAREDMQDQIEKERKMEQKAREEIQDQIAKERKMEGIAREVMQAQISELMSRCANLFGPPPSRI